MNAVNIVGWERWLVWDGLCVYSTVLHSVENVGAGDDIWLHDVAINH